jgi:integrase
MTKGKILVKTSKMGLQRNIKLSRETTDLLKDWISLNPPENIHITLFASSRTIRETWRHYRKKAYQKFKDPELLKIRLYDLRHWYGTTQYIRTRDIFHVKYLMCHRNIESTLHYMHIAKGLQDYSDEYTVKVAKNIDEFTELFEQGFEYIGEYEDKKILRKRK